MKVIQMAQLALVALLAVVGVGVSIGLYILADDCIEAANAQFAELSSAKAVRAPECPVLNCVPPESLPAPAPCAAITAAPTPAPPPVNCSCAQRVDSCISLCQVDGTGALDDGIAECVALDVNLGALGTTRTCFDESFPSGFASDALVTCGEPSPAIALCAEALACCTASDGQLEDRQAVCRRLRDQFQAANATLAFITTIDAPVDIAARGQTR